MLTRKLLTASSGEISWQSLGVDRTEVWATNDISVMAVKSGTTCICPVGNGYFGKAITAVTTDGVNYTTSTQLSTTAWGVEGVTSIAANGSIFVIGGPGGRIATSTDGLNWTYQTSLAGTSFGASTVNCLVWAGTFFLAGGPNGKIATSTDGAAWTYRSGLASTTWGSGADSSVSHAAYNGTRVCVVGGTNVSPKGAYSTDGSTWTYVAGYATASATGAAAGLTWTGTVFLAHQIGGNRTSPDGATWTGRTAMSGISGWSNTSSTIRVGSSGSLTVATSIDTTTGVSLVATSTDGITFTNRSGNGLNSSWLYQNPSNFSNVKAVVWDGTRFIVGGQTGNVSTSTSGTGSYVYQDGLGQNRSLWQSADGYAVVWTGSQWVAAGQFGKVNTSPDGYTWTFRDGLATNASFYGYSYGSSVLGLAHGGGTTVAVGTNSKDVNAACATSSDGITWTYQSGLSSAWATAGAYAYTAAYGAGTFVVGGASGRIATSADGATWTDRPSLRATGWSTTGTVNSIIFATSQFVAAGNDGKIATSPDGVTWTYQSGLRSTAWGSTADCNSITYGAGKFVVVGDLGQVATSTDTITWVYQSQLSTTDWGTTTCLSVLWDGVRFLVAGSNGSFAFSYDGVTWTTQPDLNGANLDLNALGNAGTKSVMFGGEGRYFISA